MDWLIYIGLVLFYWLGVFLSFSRIKGSKINLSFTSNEILSIFSWITFVIYSFTYIKEKDTVFFKFK